MHQFMLAVCVVFIIRILMSVRWKMLLASRSIHLSVWESVYINLVGHSVGFVSPGGLGADFMRGHHAYQKSQDLMTIANALLFDRVVGVLSMILVACLSCAMLLYFAFNVPDVVRLVFFGCLFMMLSLPLSYFLLVRLKPSLLRISGEGSWLERLLQKVYGLFELRSIPVNLLVWIAVISILMQVLRAFLFLFLFRSLSLDIELLYVLAFTPVVFIVMLLPITIGGLGLREGAIFALFSGLGVSLEQSVGAGLLFYAAQVVMVIPGLLLFLLSSLNRPRELP